MNNLLPEFKFRKVGIFGASGLIGKYLIKYLLNHTKIPNLQIIGFCHSKSSKKQLTQEFYPFKKIVSFRTQDILKNIRFKTEAYLPFDLVINAASPADPISYSCNPIGVLLTNTLGTKNILEWILRSNYETTRFVYISSGEVYGNLLNNKNGFSETDLCFINSLESRSCYPVGKIAAENLCISYWKKYGLHTYIARLCHTYGPTISENNTRADAQFLRRALAGLPIIMKSSGEQIRSYCYVEDACTAILKIATKGIPGHAYNVSNRNCVVSVREFAETMARIAQVNIQYDKPDTLEFSGFSKVPKAILNPSKLESLGWSPKFSLEEGISICLTTNATKPTSN